MTAAAATPSAYVVWLDGIGWRNDKVSEDIASDGRAVGHLLGVAEVPRAGRHPRRPARRTVHADAARRDADRRAPRPQHRGCGADHEGPARSLRARPDLQTEGRDHRLPDASRGQDGAPSLLVGRPARGRLLLPAEERPAGGTLVLGSRRRTASSRTTSSASCKNAKSPVLAHKFIDFILDEKNAYTNFLTSTATRRRRTGSTPTALVKRGVIPKTLRVGAGAPRPVRGEPATAPAERRRRAALGQGLVAVQGRLMQQSRWTWRLLALPGRRLAHRLLPRRVLRGPRRRVRQPGHALASGPVLEPARLERRVRAGDAAQLLARRRLPDGLATHDRVRCHRRRAVVC